MTEPLHHADLLVGEFELGLSRLIGKPIKEVRGYLSSLLGPELLVKLTKIEFEDGTFLSVEGEHDFPYVVSYGQTSQPNFDEATLQRLYDETKS